MLLCLYFMCVPIGNLAQYFVETKSVSGKRSSSLPLEFFEVQI